MNIGKIGKGQGRLSSPSWLCNGGCRAVGTFSKDPRTCLGGGAVGLVSSPCREQTLWGVSERRLEGLIRGIEQGF